MIFLVVSNGLDKCHQMGDSHRASAAVHWSRHWLNKAFRDFRKQSQRGFPDLSFAEVHRFDDILRELCPTQYGLDAAFSDLIQQEPLVFVLCTLQAWEGAPAPEHGAKAVSSTSIHRSM